MTACGADPVATTGSSPEPGTDTAGSTGAPDSAACLVSLHGKGGDGVESFVVDEIVHVAPRGNDEAWGGWQWDYTDDAGDEAATALVVASIDAAGCSTVAIHGFSNGASFAAKLFCRGETFGERVAGIVIDDPVPDAATADCAPAPSVAATLYWTGALASDAPAGTNCESIDWTCDGEVIVGIDAFAASAGLAITPSPFEEHRPFDDAPDPATWLASN